MEGSARATELLNEASLGDNETKSSKLAQIKHLILSTNPSLFAEFYEAVLDYQVDKNADIRKFVLDFVEEASKRNEQVPYLKDYVSTTQRLVADESVVVVKKAIMCFTSLFPVVFLHLARGTPAGNEYELWRATISVKNDVLKLLSSSNDGIKTVAIKFLQKLVLIHSAAPPGESDEKEPSVDMIRNSGILNRNFLEEEGKSYLRTFLQLFGSNLSASTLTALISTCPPMVKSRPSLATDVIKTMISLHANPPQQLSATQLKSVHHTLKLQLRILSKYPDAGQYQYIFKDTLDQLNGKVDPAEKRKAEYLEQKKKRPRREDQEFEAMDSPPREPMEREPEPAPQLFNVLQLQLPMVAEILYQSLPNLPFDMPPNFAQTYDAVKLSLGQRFVNHPFTVPNLTPRVSYMNQPGKPFPGQQPPFSTPTPVAVPLPLPAAVPRDPRSSRDPRAKDPRMRDPRMRGADSGSENATPVMSTPEAVTPSEQPQPVPIEPIRIPYQTPTEFPLIGKMKPKEFVLRPPTEFTAANALLLAKMAFERIVGAGQMIVNPLLKASWMSITTKLATKLALVQPIDWDSYEAEASEKIVAYITADPRERLELGLRWLYELYVSEESLPEENHRYEKYLLLLLTKINEGGDALDKVLGRLLMDAPELPPAALNFVKECTDTNERAQLGFTLLKDLVIQRAPYREPLLKLLFDKMIHEDKKIRTLAVNLGLGLYTVGNLGDAVEECALTLLSALEQPMPNCDSVETDPVMKTEAPEMSSAMSVDDAETPAGAEAAPVVADTPPAAVWNDASVTRYTDLFFALSKKNPAMLNELSNVFVKSGKDVQKCIRTIVFEPVKEIGPAPEILEMIRQFPAGSEDLIVRIIFTITDRGKKPSKETVQVVKEVFEKTGHNPNFLIPILPGLSKAEIIDNLPYLIDNQAPLKEVVSRLVDQSKFSSAISPSELLIQLHFINPTKHKIGFKRILEAMDLCFTYKTVFTQPILATVLQKLHEQSQLPELLMRTVIKSHEMAPALGKYILTNTFQEMIKKAFWTSKQLWTGFVKFCNSMSVSVNVINVLQQLPKPQQKAFLTDSPKFKPLLRDHAEKTGSKSLLQVLDELDQPAGTPGEPTETSLPVE